MSTDDKKAKKEEAKRAKEEARLAKKAEKQKKGKLGDADPLAAGTPSGDGGDGDAEPPSGVPPRAMGSPVRGFSMSELHSAIGGGGGRALLRNNSSGNVARGAPRSASPGPSAVGGRGRGAQPAAPPRARPPSLGMGSGQSPPFAGGGPPSGDSNRPAMTAPPRVGGGRAGRPTPSARPPSIGAPPQAAPPHLRPPGQRPGSVSGGPGAAAMSSAAADARSKRMSLPATGVDAPLQIPMHIPGGGGGAPITPSSLKASASIESDIGRPSGVSERAWTAMSPEMKNMARMSMPAGGLASLATTTTGNASDLTTGRRCVAAGGKKSVKEVKKLSKADDDDEKKNKKEEDRKKKEEEKKKKEDDKKKKEDEKLKKKEEERKRKEDQRKRKDSKKDDEEDRGEAANVLSSFLANRPSVEDLESKNILTARGQNKIKSGAAASHLEGFLTSRPSHADLEAKGVLADDKEVKKKKKAEKKAETKMARRMTLAMKKRKTKNDDPGAGGAPVEETTSVFGIPLAEVCCELSEVKGVPDILYTCIEFLKAAGLQSVGLFRVTGASGEVAGVVKLFNEDRVLPSDVCDVEPHVIATVLKKFLRELPEPLLTFKLYDEFIKAAGMAEGDEQTTVIGDLVARLPEQNRQVTAYLMDFLHEVSEHCAVNMMECGNLAIVFGPNLLVKENPDPMDMLTHSSANEVIEVMVKYANTLFDGVQGAAPEPPVVESDSPLGAMGSASPLAAGSSSPLVSGSSSPLITGSGAPRSGSFSRLPPMRAPPSLSTPTVGAPPPSLSTNPPPSLSTDAPPPALVAPVRQHVRSQSGSMPNISGSTRTSSSPLLASTPSPSTGSPLSSPVVRPSTPPQVARRQPVAPRRDSTDKLDLQHPDSPARRGPLPVARPSPPGRPRSSSSSGMETAADSGRRKRTMTTPSKPAPIAPPNASAATAVGAVGGSPPRRAPPSMGAAPIGRGGGGGPPARGRGGPPARGGGGPPARGGGEPPARGGGEPPARGGGGPPARGGGEPPARGRGAPARGSPDPRGRGRGRARGRGQRGGASRVGRALPSPRKAATVPASDAPPRGAAPSPPTESHPTEQSDTESPPTEQSDDEAPPPTPPPPAPLPAPSVLKSKALYDFAGDESQGQIGFSKDDEITIMNHVPGGWSTGMCNGKTGLFPSNYVQE